MATIRKRTLPSGLVRWQVDFNDQAGKRRSKLFPRRKDADVHLVKVRSLVANNTYLADSESVTVADAAKAWLNHCEVRCKTGRRMERSTLPGKIQRAVERLATVSITPCDTNATRRWPDVPWTFFLWGAEVWWVFQAKTPSEEGGLSDVVASNTTAVCNVAAANVIFGALH